MDRIDIRLEIRPVSYRELFSDEKGMSSDEAREKIMIARERQEARYINEDFTFHSEIPQGKIGDFIHLGTKEENLLQRTYEDSNMSARGYYRILRLARTVADINDREDISTDDIEHALYYRNETETSVQWL